MSIRQLTVVTQVGVRVYEVGASLDYLGEKICLIELGTLTFTGESCSQYLGFNDKGKMIFSVDPKCPHTVDYL